MKKLFLISLLLVFTTQAFSQFGNRSSTRQPIPKLSYQPNKGSQQLDLPNPMAIPDEDCTSDYSEIIMVLNNYNAPQEKTPIMEQFNMEPLQIKQITVAPLYIDSYTLEQMVQYTMIGSLYWR